MAQRDTTNFRQVTNVVPKQVAAEQETYQGPSVANQLLNVASDIGSHIIKAGQEAKINENYSAAQLELNQLQQQYEIDYEGDPFKGMAKLKDERQKVFDKYGSDISPFFKKPWQDMTRELGAKNEAQGQAWAFKQTRVNTVNSINNSIKNNLSQAMIDGQNFGNSDETEFGAFVNYADSKSKLIDFGDKNLGHETTTGMLENFDKDYLKSFISGVAEANPKKAASLLEKEDFKKSLRPEEISEFEKVIAVQEKKNRVGSLFSQSDNEDKITNLVNQPGDYLVKRLEIDKMELTGGITPGVAEKARRVLTSQKAVDAKTSNDDMGEIITQIYDLNAVQDTNSEDYLIGVQNIREDILKRQAEGKLSTEDAQKLNGQMQTLTSQKISDATQKVATDLYESNEKFNQLPPEYRGQATRKLFYKTIGKDIPKEKYNQYANEIIDGINKNVRTDTLKRLQSVKTPDEDFLKTKGYTMDDVRETATKYGMSEDEVIQKLKAK